MSILSNLLIKLGLDSKDFDKGIEGAKQKTNAFASGIKSLGGMIAGAFAVSSVVAFAKQIFTLANESIKAENELGAAIRANGKDVENTMKQYKLFANEMLNVSTTDDEVTLGMLRLAETMQSKAPMEAVKNALALSKALGIDLQTAVKMAVLAQQDMYTMLQRYVPALREAGTEAEKTAAYNRILASGQAMLNDELNTSAGKIIQNTNLWNNIKEEWGTVISKSGLLNSALDGLNKRLIIQGSDLSYFQKTWYMITGQYDKGIAKVKELEAAAKAAASGQTTPTVLGEVTVTGDKNIKETQQKAAEAAKALREKITQENEKLFIEQVRIFNEFYKSIGEESADAFVDGFGKISQSQNDIQTALNMMTPESDAPENNDGVKKEKAALDARLENWSSFKSEMAALAFDFSVDVAEEFGNALGEMMRTGEFPEDFGNNILAGIGSFISQLGKMLIGLGVASEAFQALLNSAFTNPVSAGLAIAAGAALVLLGGAISGYAKSKGSGSTSGSVSTPAYSKAGGYSNNSKQAQSKVVFEIEGTKLKGVLANVERKYAYIR